MSSTDVRDVLNLPARHSLEKPLVKKLKTDGDNKRPEGMQRELYSLLGENTPPIAVIENVFKDKPSWNQKVTPWKWVPFENGAREDGLKLYHWVRGEPGTEEYSFAKLNQKIKMIDFTQEEYDRLLQDDDWTYEETKYLFQLCEDYELRWIVVHDRYHGTKPRSVEDLKARYYSINRILLREKQNEDLLTPDEEENYKQMNYSKEHEQKRKEHLERLLSRSPAEVAEEEALVIESRKLEAAAERMLQERSELLRLLDAPQSTGSVAPYQSSQGLAQLTATLLTTDRVRKKTEDTTAVANTNHPAAPTAPIAPNNNNTTNGSSGVPNSNNSSNSTTKQEKPTPEPSKKGAASGMLAVQQLIKRKLNAKEEAAFGLSYHDKMSAGVYLRSSKVTTYKPSIQAKVNAVLTELGLPARPTMPTAKVCAKFESLQHSIGLLLEAKKQIDKLETEISIAKGQGGKP